MGIESTLGMRHGAYQEETCQFQATLKVNLVVEGTRRAQDTGGGSIVFMGANRITYTTTFNILVKLYGFVAEGNLELANEVGENVQLGTSSRMQFFSLGGLVSVIRHSLRHDDLFPRTEELHPSVPRIFLKGLLDVQHWRWTRVDETPSLSIVGWITPILKFIGVPSKS
ncbi:unnamed protein product [Cochlearia groenlandica]